MTSWRTPRRRAEKRHWIVFDCGIVLVANWPSVRGDPRRELRVGDWVYAKGRMDAKIVGEKG
ncbi:hypothetical protein [Pyrodictium abyssi]|uniref:hypothetical protein n=1 Tax=Pyrodictium abyssi TaxID=54256 RepID=UPI0030C784AB